MRIAVIAHMKYAIAEPFAGGLEKHTHMLAHGLRRRGHDVTLFAADGSDEALGLEVVCAPTARATGLPRTEADVLADEHVAYSSLMGELRRRRFDVIHNNALHYLPLDMAGELAAPMLTSLHTPPFPLLEDGVRAAPASMRYAAVSEATARMWDPILTVDEVVLNGVDLAQFPFARTAVAPPYLVWYGRIVPEKGLHLAIEAARLAGLPLRIAGPISDASYWEAAIRPRLGPAAVHVGHLCDQALAGLIGGASAMLCTPCWEEPYGLVVAEALACGTPVAAFRRGGVPEIVDPTCGVLAEPDCVRSLAAAAHGAMALDRGACRARAAAVCDVERMLTGYEAIYRALAAPGVEARTAAPGQGRDARPAILDLA